MRELKFRAWDKVNKKMIQVGAVATIPLGSVVSEKYEFEKTSWIASFELMQFTGLLDKNGIEIYDGDIVQYQNRSQSLTYKGQIIWPEDYAGFCVTANNGTFLDAIKWLHNLEVIGNIYENPALLTP